MGNIEIIVSSTCKTGKLGSRTEIPSLHTEKFRLPYRKVKALMQKR